MTFQKKTIQRFMTLGALVSATALSLSMTACDDGGDADGGAGMGGMATGGTTSGSGGSGTGGGTASGGTGGEAPAADDIVDVASANEDFSILVAAVAKAGLVEALRGDDLTVFAPTNAAFEALFEAIGVDGLDDLSAEQLKPILLYHVVGSVVNADAATDLAEGAGEFDALGGNVKIAVGDDGLLLDGVATVTTPNIEASNGLIHVIDAVILPSITDIVVSNAEFSGLASLVVAADGDADSDPKIGAALDGEGAFTLFAPSNDAVAALLESLGDDAPSGQALTDILRYHALGTRALSSEIESDEYTPLLPDSVLTVTVADGGVTIAEGANGAAEVEIVDILAENGVIHVISDVLLPPSP